jgi:HSP20 family protein
MEDVKVSKQPSVAKAEAAPLSRVEGIFTQTAPLGRWLGMSPFALMREFTNEMDRAFRTTGLPASEVAGMWSPTVDVRQCDGDLVVTAEVPGLKKEEINVELSEDALVIEGERKREHKEDHEGYHRFERNYGKFYRSIPLPEGAKTDQVKAELQDGVLKVSIPVPQAEKKVRQIPIETRSGAKA